MSPGTLKGIRTLRKIELRKIELGTIVYAENIMYGPNNEYCGKTAVITEKCSDGDYRADVLDEDGKKIDDCTLTKSDLISQYEII